MSRSRTLLRLQDVDTELDARQARVRAIEKILGDAPAVRAAQARTTAAQAALTKARAALKEQELEVLGLTDKITDAGNRLYSGRITNPKELRDLEQDVASLKRHRGTVEEKQLEALIEMESAEAELGAAQASLRSAEAEAAKTQGNLLDERATLTTLIDKLATEREAIISPVPSADRETYDRLRQSKRGRAVSRLEDDVCSACGVSPSSSRGQSARQGNELIFCGSCGRILCGE